MHPPGPVATGSIPQHPHPCGGVLGPDVLEEGCGGPREPHPQWAGVERWCEVMVLLGCLAASSLVSQDRCTQVPGAVPWGPSGTATSVTLCPCPSLRTLRSPAHPREQPALTRAELYSRRPVLSAHGAPDSRSPARPSPGQRRISLFQQQTSGSEDGRGVLSHRPGGEGAPASASGRFPRQLPGPRSGRRRPGVGGGARRATAGEGLTFLAAERRVPGEREEGAQAEEQQRQEGAIAEPHLLRCAVGAGGAEAAWPGGAGAGARGPGGCRGPGPGAGRGWEPGAGQGCGRACRVGNWVGHRADGSSGARGVALLVSALGPGQAGLGWAVRAAARPGSRAAAESAAKGGAAGI